MPEPAGFRTQSEPSAQLEDLFPPLFVPRPLLYFVCADRIDRRGRIFSLGSTFGCDGVRPPAAYTFCPSSLATQRKNSRAVFGWGASFASAVPESVAISFGQHKAKRRAFPNPRRIVMGVAGDTGGRLPGNEKLGELGVSLVKLDAICRQLAHKFNRFLVVFVFMSRQPYEQFHIPRFGDQPPLPSWGRQSPRTASVHPLS